MKYQIKWRIKGEILEQISPQIFYVKRTAQTVCDEWNDLDPNIENWVVDITEEQFPSDGETIIPNPVKE